MERLTEIIPVGMKNRPGVKIEPSKVTIHNTSNTNPKATAKAHSKLIRKYGYYKLPSGKKNWVSWHFTVDDKYIISQLPLNEKGWHAGGPGNSKSIGIEVCMYAGIDQSRANTNASKLVVYLCKKLNLQLSDVVTHNYWTGKNCPELLLSDWEKFIEEVHKYLNSFNPNEIEEFELLGIRSVEEINDEDINIDEIEFNFSSCRFEGEE